jgi:Domain of unknown function (DUF4381)
MSAAKPDPALDKLHDFYQPAPPAWTPHTIGWYILFAILALAILWFVFRAIRSRYINRYRRAALRELITASPDQLSALLKRTALAVWPREKIASLTGEPWLKFLNETAATESFLKSPGNRIELLAVGTDVPSADDAQQLKTIIAEWIRRHRVQA